MSSKALDCTYWVIKTHKKIVTENGIANGLVDLIATEYGMKFHPSAISRACQSLEALGAIKRTKDKSGILKYTGVRFVSNILSIDMAKPVIKTKIETEVETKVEVKSGRRSATERLYDETKKLANSDKALLISMVADDLMNEIADKEAKFKSILESLA